MSDSYSKQAKTWCDRYDLTLEDTSTVFQYEVILTAPEGCVLWSSEAERYTIRQTRQRGSRKDRFWQRVEAEASTGAIDRTRVKNWVPAAVWDIPPQ